MHIPVLRKEIIELLQLKKGDKVIDATLGLGGHSEEILKVIGKSGHLYAFEQDGRNLERAKERLREFESQVTYFHTNFVSLKTCLAAAGSSERAVQPPSIRVDAILFDLGLSSPHVDDSSRGFSFREDGPLDMRFDSREDLTAADIVNRWPEPDLVEIFSKYGEERASKKVAAGIVARRKEKHFETTLDLAGFIRELKQKFPSKKDHATQVFQALRMAVNDEVSVLEEVLPQAIEVLKPGGRLAVISYHSIEDRIVKNIFRDYSKDLDDPNEPLINKVIREKQVEIITKKPIVPTEEEISENPRARSAKLRIIGKI
ncbi:MAG: 16S rRNA (cytosine(1402)-N(4))-methyltransferase RsmH [Patescibacteria group bacterium]|nr:16S rRNA (cytosine(1402)-N(4))-methyltransferase RsmH [Patescibacteria group bacterium]